MTRDKKIIDGMMFTKKYDNAVVEFYPEDRTNSDKLDEILKRLKEIEKTLERLEIK